MQATDYLALMGILVTAAGLALAFLAFIEWKELRKLRKDFLNLEASIRKENHLAMKAAHRVISSYAVTDVDARIALLESAVSGYPGAFNGYNALGYAYLEKGDIARAIDAFHRAIALHPDDKEGYCDLAYAYHGMGDDDLAVLYFRKAVDVDPSAQQDIASDERVAHLVQKIGA